jgi:hypothetical protein
MGQVASPDEGQVIPPYEGDFNQAFAELVARYLERKRTHQVGLARTLAALEAAHRVATDTERRRWERRISDWTGAALPDTRRPEVVRQTQLALGELGIRATNHHAWLQLIKATRQRRRRATRSPVPARPGLRGMWTAYRKQQVSRITPPELLDRQAELQELAGFCTGPDRGPYVWWRAPAWAGKSALLSTFVLHPPAGVQIVSFFITARLGAQDTREAFVQVLLEQLSELTGIPLSPALTEVVRETYLLDLLEQAAETCQTVGGRLILLVDGLDEDRGTTVGPDAHSIAGLLPAAPAAGMRVIVSGRPNPPIPDDVPDWHPLRDPTIIRPLDPSPAARDLQRLSQAEVKRLLHGSPIEQGLLGLLTAARGGLSGPDLHTLTGVPLWQIEDVLHTVVGRTFGRRASTWAPETGPEVYLLGHEELQETARRYLGDQRLKEYQDRLHTWADTYQQHPRTHGRSWPPQTPEYLLRGYFRMLTALGDIPRMVTYATDTARHDQMLRLTGGDAAALTEITTTLNLIKQQDDPDLIGALRLAHHRDQLSDRNSNTPAGLPAVWATLGQPTRAHALARSITDPDQKADALVRLAEALVAAGHPERAARVAAAAETAARSITDPDRKAAALGRVAKALAAGEHPERAEAIACAITHPDRKADALVRLAEALAAAGHRERAVGVAAAAETAARSITDPDRKADALRRVVEALVAAGHPERAARVTAAAETAARAVTHPDRKAAALRRVVEALAAAGHPEQAARVAADAETAARSITNPDRKADTLVRLAMALAAAGHPERAEAIARSINDPSRQAAVLGRVAGALAAAGHSEQAARVAADAETAAHAITDPGRQADALRRVARALAAAGHSEQAARVAADAETAARAITDPEQQVAVLGRLAMAFAAAGQLERAEAIARAITHPHLQAAVLVRVAGALATAGHPERAAQVAADAETIARAITNPYRKADALVRAAGALATAGHPERAAQVAADAETAARAITSPYRQAEALERVAGALAAAGHSERAEAIARAITHPRRQADALVWLAGALATAGQPERAEATARAITNPYRKADALVRVAGALAAAGLPERAARVAADAETAARSITEPGRQADALVRVAGALAAAGLPERAEAIARSITEPGRQADALRRVAGALAAAGLPERAEAIAFSITDPYLQADALRRVAGAFAAAGLPERAEAIARAITSPYRKADALVRVAGALAAAGHPERAARVAADAETAARAITSPYRKADALVRVAGALATAGHPEQRRQGRRLVAEVCATEVWTVPLAPLMVLEPASVDVIVSLARTLP